MEFNVNDFFDRIERETEVETEAPAKVQRAFRGKNIGGNDPQNTSINAIWEAVRDYEMSRNWN